jgi:hypothetical protein
MKMTNEKIEMKLKYPALFQTNIYLKEEITASPRPIKTGTCTIYKFPKEYLLEDMISDAKKYVQEDKANSGIFPAGISAEAELIVKDAKHYLDKAQQIANEIKRELDKNSNSFSRNKLLIQTCEFSDHTFDMDQSYLILKDNWQKEMQSVNSSFSIDGTHKLRKIKFEFYKVREYFCSLEEIEKFYKATMEIYKKLLT